MAIRQKKDEPFWEYIEMFNKETILIKDVDDKIKWCLLKQGLLRGTNFVKSIGFEALRNLNHLQEKAKK